MFEGDGHSQGPERHVVCIRMRNRLVHAYFEIDADILWVAATVDIPALLIQLQVLAGKD